MSRWAHQGSCKRAAAGLSESSESQTMRKKQFAKEDAANTMPCGEQSPFLASAKQKAARLNRIETNCDSALESGSTMALTSSAHKINRMSSKTSMRKNQQVSIKLVKKRYATRGTWLLWIGKNSKIETFDDRFCRFDIVLHMDADNEGWPCCW